MRLLQNTSFDFMGKRKIAAMFSGTIIAVGLLSLIVNGGPLLGIDFTGGTLAQLRFTSSVETGALRETLLDAGFSNPSIQRFGDDHEILLRVPADEAGAGFAERLQEVFAGQSFEIRRLEQIGPKIGGEMRGKALAAVFYALLGILLYITFRFDRYYAVGAVAALAHDVIITLGIFSLLRLEIDLAIVAAFLTIVGYSLNDTIVVFDRIRENARADRRADFTAMVNHSINQTLGRTIITSVTTFVVVLVLYLIGGEVIRYFAFALMVGVVVGTYSSIYIASPIMAILEARAQTRVASK
ncbi:MAG: protein translocase subunit SecF [Candidatus Marinimicrobia bacterium]|nr:protein translocase subunit SecF [Candidatus Neomarinimicrobiota bacterium]